MVADWETELAREQEKKHLRSQNQRHLKVGSVTYQDKLQNPWVLLWLSFTSQEEKHQLF